MSDSPGVDVAAVKNEREAASLQVSIDDLLTEQTMPFTPVDGQGMWRAWVRTFEKPEAACLDLLDNCFDATLHQGFNGKVVMDALDLESGFPPDGITMMNNSLMPIKSLKDALTIYKSSKNSSLFRGDSAAANGDSVAFKKDAIGENGVGLKHGCATLSDVSFIVTRNVNKIEVGLIAKQLQSSKGVCLPYFSFDVPESFDDEQVSLIVETALELDSNTVFSAVVTQTLGRGDRAKGKNALEKLVRKTWKGDWRHEDHIFLLVLHKLHHMVDKFEVIDVEEPVSPAKEFLDNVIKPMLPEHYALIHVPSDANFEVSVNHEKINFAHWQTRLVHLSQFAVNVPPDTALNNCPLTSDWTKKGYKFKIYCGFDAQRARKDLKRSEKPITNCKLYIYSRQAGRLVQKYEDGRQAMHLASSGVDYCQGLTVIVEDLESQLPLKPTKDGIAWSERKGGEAFKKNLFAYAAGAARVFWKEASFMMPNKMVKKALQKVVAAFAEKQDQTVASTVTPKCMHGADFQEFILSWKIKPSKTDVHIHHQKHKGVYVEEGSDTLFKLTQDHVNDIVAAMSDGNTGNLPSEGAASSASAPASDVSNLVTPESDRRRRHNVTVGSIVVDRKRNASSKPVDYYGERVIPAPVQTNRPRKKARNSTKSAKARGSDGDDDHEQKRIEAEIKLKQEQLKNIEAQTEIEELRAQLQSLQNGAIPPAHRSTGSQSKVYSDLARITAERDNLQEEVERLRNSKPLAVNGRTQAGDQNELHRVQAELEEVKRNLAVWKMKYEAMMKTDRGRASQQY